MVLVTSLQDRLALEIGAQVIARHRVEVEVDAMRERIAALEAGAGVAGRGEEPGAAPNIEPPPEA